MFKFFEDTGCGVVLLGLTIFVLALIGEVRCIYKAINCDWEPKYKAEIVYTGASLTGLGSIVGWMDIEDEKTKSGN